MSWHKTHRTNSVYQAVLVSLFGMASLNAYAMNLGQANIKSAQHEPLSATINVTNIDAANFHASVASRDIYRQMGLSPDDDISVTFTPTSKSAGQITLTSNKPIATPFADVVLNLNNNGEQIIEPQTLLMPLPSGNAFTLPDDKATQVLTSDTRPNLPKVTPAVSGEASANGENANPPVSAQIINQRTPVLEPMPTAVGSANAEGNIISRQGKVLSQRTPDNTNVQMNILTEEIVRRVYPAGQAPKSPTLPTPTPTPQTAPPPKAETKNTTANAGTGSVVYVVQQGDSLWSIADTIAKANDMRVSDVMIAIHKANPDAFNNGKVEQLKVDANLSIPKYRVVLSQQAISDAIRAKREHTKESGSTTAKKTSKQSNKPQTAKATSTPKRSSQVTAKPVQKALPKAQMTLVTPTQQGKATGTNSKAVPSAVAGGDGNLTGTLKTTRQQTANQAKRVNSLNQELSSAAKKVQIQNQKLAELEQRLKSLQEKK